MSMNLTEIDHNLEGCEKNAIVFRFLKYGNLEDRYEKFQGHLIRETDYEE